MKKKIVSCSSTKNLNHDKLMKLVKWQFIFGIGLLLVWWIAFQNVFWASIFAISLAFIDLVKLRTRKVGFMLIGCRFFIGIGFLVVWWLAYRNVFWLSILPFISGSMELKEFLKKE